MKTVADSVFDEPSCAASPCDKTLPFISGRRQPSQSLAPEPIQALIAVLGSKAVYQVCPGAFTPMQR
jgi:hypothetical protein